jgi:pimeloyl-ACP methyl ester carboxylesterase
MSGWPDGRGPASRWRDDPDGSSPLVLVLGGFLTSPPLYLPLARRLLRRGAADVVIGRVWTPDWLLAAGRGLGPNLTRAGRALVRAGERSALSTAARGAPVLVVGHSAGGMLGRLLTSPVPFQGRRLGAAPRIGALVTLGTPHHTSPSGDIGGRVGSMASAFADEVIPGAAFAPQVGYVTVASRAIVGSVGGDQRARTALRFNTSTLRARSGRITIVMTNASKSLAHGIAVGNVRGRIVKPGRSSSVTVNLRRGRYQFHCPVKGHRAAGMRGTLIVS